MAAHKWLHGIHDQDGAELMADKPGWIICTEAIGSNPKDTSGVNFYAWTSRGYGVIVRLNNGYYSEHSYPGTIPTPDRYDDFAVRCANFVAASHGCDIVIIGNEPNMTAETPDRKGIQPADYARCYQKCRQAIHRVNPNAQVLVAGCAPWNQQSGDWLDYWRIVLANVGEECDGASIHVYSHGSDPSLITSEEMVHGWHWHFRVYQDQLEAMPAILYGLPVFISETDQDDPWADTNSGWVQEAYAEIDRWNQGSAPTIHALCLFRSQPDDRWSFADKNGVKADFRAAVARGYTIPDITPPSPPAGPEPPGPEPTPPTPAPGPLEWDKRLSVRGCTLQQALMPAEILPRVRIGRWFNEEEAQGRVNIYVRLLDENGKLAIGVPMTFFWADGNETKPTERKSDPWLAAQGLGAEYSLDFAMYNVAPSYGVRVTGGYQGDIIEGCGLGSIEQPDYKIHTAYFFEWQLTTEDVTTPEPEPPTPTPTPPADRLIWPVTGPVTQYFGKHDLDYPGAPGHDGIDFGVVTGTPVLAVADGVVKWVSNDPSGFGLYVRIFHPAYGFHSFMAHLSEQRVQVGDVVGRGQTVALSGSTGNSTGPHLHFSCRIGEEDDYYELHDGYRNGATNPLAVYGLINRVDPNSTLVSRG